MVIFISFLTKIYSDYETKKMHVAVYYNQIKNKPDFYNFMKYNNELITFDLKYNYGKKK